MPRARMPKAAPRESTAREPRWAPRDTRMRAAAVYRALLADDPHHAGALQGLARVAMSERHHDEAVSLLERAIAREPAAASLHADLAEALERLGRSEAARAAHARAIALDPALAQPLAQDERWRLGERLVAMGRPAEAAVPFAALVEAHPESALARVRLGECYAAAGRTDLALEHFAAAARRDPERADALLGIGHALRAQGRRDEALVAYRAAARARPEDGEALRWLAQLALDEGHSAEALEHARGSLAREPASAAAHQLLARILLQRGELLEGWAEHAHRLDARPAPVGAGSEWQGEELAGRRVWVPREPGLSDEILFVCCLDELIRRGADVVAECDAQLLTLFARSFPAAAFVAREGDDPVAGAAGARFWVASGTLAARFRGDLEHFPAPEPYLVPDPAAVSRWRERFGALGKGLRVGLSWRGGRDPAVRRTRSSPLAAFARLGRVPGVRLVSLQYGDTAQELAEMRARGLELQEWPEQPLTGDLDALAARIAALDLVITVDNSTAHLAGALGVPALVLVPMGADWCWFEDRKDSPWYANLRLYRQSRPGDWTELLARVERKLHEPGTFTPPRVAPSRVSTARALACLVNDRTYTGDWGSAGSTRALASELEQRGYAVSRVSARGIASLREGPRTVADFDDPAVWARVCAANRWLARTLERASEVVVNDGGQWCRVGRAALDLMYVTYAARAHAGRNVRLVNHTCAPARLGPPGPGGAWALRRRVYGALDEIVARDAGTRDRLALAGVRATLAGDTLALAIAERAGALPAGRPRAGVVLSGILAADEFPLAAFGAFVEAARAGGAPVTLLRGGAARSDAVESERARALASRAGEALEGYEARTFDDWLTGLLLAQVVVTARFPDGLAAAALGTPVVLLDGAAHACEGLAALLGSTPPLHLGAPDLVERMTESVAAARLCPPGVALPTRSLERLCRCARRTLATLPEAVE